MEFNGLGSVLKGYPGGEPSALGRMHDAVASVGLPLYAYPPDAGDSSWVAGTHPIAEAERFYGGNHLDKVTDLRDAEAIVWGPLIAQKSVDQGRAIVVNPPDFDDVLQDKTNVKLMCERAGLPEHSPRTWPYHPADAIRTAERVLDEHPEIERFVTKPAFGSNSQGVHAVPRDQLMDFMTDRFVKAPPALSLSEARDSAPEEFWMRRFPFPFLLQEYAPSGLITAEDGHEYDATMRVGVLGIANRDVLATVPIVGYWKTPHEPAESGWSDDSAISDIDSPVSNIDVNATDFQVAFRTVSPVLRCYLEATRQRL